MSRTCSTNGEKRNTCRVMMREPEGKRPLGKPTCERVLLGEIGWSCMYWIRLAQDGDQWRALVNTVMNIRDP
jgi:hypothetical protein